MKFKGTELVEKRNALNEIRHNDMTLQELRFFSIYLSKINARDKSTRRVNFKLEDFKKIMSIEKVTIQHFKNVTDKLLCKIVHVPNEDGSRGYTAFQIFKRCRLYENKDDYNQWYVEIDAHDDALPLMFNLKKNYFAYELWNALRLKSRNQLHMYELLKQYEAIGIREIKLDYLKDWLGISKNEYPRWDRFKSGVIEVCQKALKQYTDIQFEYEPMKTGRKVTGVRFLISKNKDYEDPLCLSEFIENLSPGTQSVDDQDISNPYNELIETLASLCNNEFDKEQMIVIKDLLLKMEYCRDSNMMETYDYLIDKYHEVNANKKIPKGATQRRFGFLKWLIKFDISEYMTEEEK